MIKSVLFAIVVTLAAVIFSCYMIAIPIAFSFMDASFLNPIVWPQEIRGAIGSIWAIVQFYVVMFIFGHH